MITKLLSLRDRSAKATLKYFGHDRSQFIWSVGFIAYWSANMAAWGAGWFFSIFYWFEVLVFLAPMALAYRKTKRKDNNHDD